MTKTQAKELLENKELFDKLNKEMTLHFEWEELKEEAPKMSWYSYLKGYLMNSYESKQECLEDYELAPFYKVWYHNHTCKNGEEENTQSEIFLIGDNKEQALKEAQELFNEWSKEECCENQHIELSYHKNINGIKWDYERVEYSLTYSEYKHKTQDNQIIEVGNNFWPKTKKWMWEVKVNGKKIDINKNGGGDTTGTNRESAFHIATEIIKGERNAK